MGAYTIAADNIPTPAGPTPVLTVTSGASSAFAVLDLYAAHNDSAFGGSHDLIRATGGTASTTIASEEINTKQAADQATTSTDWSGAPAISGRPVIQLPWSVTTVIVGSRRWMPPDPRQPFLADANGAQVELRSDSAGVTFDRLLTFAEPSEISYRAIFGRKYNTRRRGRFIVQDELRSFGGLATAPLHFAAASASSYLQLSDWPDSVNASMGGFLNLLNAAGGGSVFTETATVTADAFVTAADALSAAGIGTITAAATVTATSAAAFRDSATIAAAASVTAASRATFAGTGTIAAAASVLGADAARFGENGTVAAAASTTGVSIAVFVESSTVVAVASITGSDALQWTETGAVLATASVTGGDVAAFVESGTISAAAFVRARDIKSGTATTVYAIFVFDD